MEESTLKLEVVTPEEPVLSEEATEVILPGEVGQVGVLPDHVPLIASLQAGEMKVHESGLTKKLFIEGGFAEVLDNEVSVLAEKCIFAEDIDIDAVQEDLEEYEDELERLSDLPSEEYDGDLNKAIDEVREKKNRAEIKLAVATDGKVAPG